jgi:hypothetical protein
MEGHGVLSAVGGGAITLTIALECKRPQSKRDKEGTSRQYFMAFTTSGLGVQYRVDSGRRRENGTEWVPFVDV